jgi:hypothetical protein
MPNNLFLCLLCLLINSNIKAGNVKGLITDDKETAVPFASVFVAGTTIGTTSNENGFYMLTLKPGSYTITVKSIGYGVISKNIDVNNQEQALNFTLKEETIKIKEFTVNSDSEDPAYAVIRNAIKKRKFYKDQVDAFSCDVYIKGVQKLRKKPNRVMGLKVSMNASWDTASGIIYMSESVSKYNFKQPKKIKEEMISSLVSGNNQAFSYNQASDMFFNFYENVMDVVGLGARGFISPIANNAFLTYRYKLVGTFYDQGQLVNKIQVIPKRKNDPAFAGIIYIMEDSWRIHSTNLYLTKDAQIDFVDTLQIEQVYLPVTPEVWMPFSNNYTFTFDILGFKGGGNYVSMNSNYKLNPVFPDNFFNNNILEIKEGANKKDTAYWNQYRPVPLTETEKRDYVWRDSITAIKESKPYLDSVDRVKNKFRLGNLIFGYDYSNSYKKKSFRINSPISTVLFNTVQGLTLGTRITYTQRLAKLKRNTLTGLIGYGFANKTYFGDISYSKLYNPLKFASFTIAAGSVFEQYQPASISELLNTSYTLLDERNYLKIYKSDFLSIKHFSEIFNGFYLGIFADYSYRSAVVNQSNFTLVNKDNRVYFSNNPVAPDNNNLAFKAHHLIKIKPEITIKFKQQFLSQPDDKILLDSKFPTLKLAYTLGYTANSSKKSYFDRATASISQNIPLKLFGEINYEISAGKTFLTKPIYFMDFMHFNGNKTLFSNLETGNFMLLDYYAFSTDKYFLQAHAIYNLEGFFFNKIPALKLLRLQEIISLHYLKNDKIDNYLEVGFGVQRLFARIEFVTAYSSKTKLSSGIRLRLGF